jgi:hypothetical protein
MTAYTTVDASIASGITDLAAQLVQVANGDTCEVGTSNLFYVMNNGSGSTVTATISTPGSVNGLAIADATLAVPTLKLGLIPLTMLFRGATGRATITFSATTTVTGGVVRLVF